MKRNLFLCALVLILGIGFSGCQLFELRTNADGKQTTDFESHAQTVANIGKVSASYLPQPIGLAVGGIATILGLIGTAATAVVVARKRGGALEAVIQGVEEANNPEVKKSIRNAAIDLGYQPYLEKVVEANTPQGKPV